MVRLTRIYTRTGDSGETSLGDMSRTHKNDERLVAYADVDETNSAIGVALALGELPGEIVTTLARIQNELFDVGADLCTPLVPESSTPSLRVTPAYVEALEADCDRYNEALPALTSFILPGGAKGAALLHAARTVARRAERSIWRALQVHGSTMSTLPAQYMNRLSDLLFILARCANAEHGDVLWVPGSGRER